MERTGLLKPTQSPPRKTSRRKPPWLLELGALLLSSSALITAAAILASQDSKPVTEWAFPASLNTVVAVLGAINKGTLAFAVSACLGQHKWNLFRAERGRLALFERFDEASRGPWGSAKLMLETRLRGWANVGALALILSLALDPFLQAAVTLSGKVTPVEGSAAPSLPDGQRIDMGRLIPEKRPHTMDWWAGLEYIEDSFRQEYDLGLTSAIYDGLSHSARAPTDDPKVPFQCSTGNCTWPAFTSVGVCSTCNDVTSALVKRKNETHCEGYVGMDLSGKRCTTFSAGYSRIGQYNGHLLTEGSTLADILDPMSRLANGVHAVLLTANITMDYTKTVSFKDTKTLFLSYLVMRVGDDFVRNETAWEDSEPTATECGLYFCTKAFESKVENGKLVEEQLGQWADRDPKSWKMLGNPGAADFMEKHPSLDPMNYYLTDLVLTVPKDATRGKEVATRFNITQATVRGLQDSLKFLTMDTFHGTNGTATEPVRFPLAVRATYDYPIGSLLWNTTNATTIFDRLANRLTVAFRSSLPSTQAGTLRLYSLHVAVLWPYLVLPAAALAVGWAYLALVALRTRRVGLPVVKESVYPALAHGFDEGTQAFLRMLEAGPEAGRKLRDNLMVGLADGPDGMRLQMSGGSPYADRKECSNASVGALGVVEGQPTVKESDQSRRGADEV